MSCINRARYILASNLMFLLESSSSEEDIRYITGLLVRSDPETINVAADRESLELTSSREGWNYRAHLPSMTAGSSAKEDADEEFEKFLLDLTEIITGPWSTPDEVHEACKIILKCSPEEFRAVTLNLVHRPACRFIGVVGHGQIFLSGQDYPLEWKE
jgi:hypothetical protein